MSSEAMVLVYCFTGIGIWLTGIAIGYGYRKGIGEKHPMHDLEPVIFWPIMGPMYIIAKIAEKITRHFKKEKGEKE
jgi:hypothetical protein